MNVQPNLDNYKITNFAQVTDYLNQVNFESAMRDKYLLDTMSVINCQWENLGNTSSEDRTSYWANQADYT